MSYASQQDFEALGELVDDLMERLEAAEAKAEEQEAEISSLRTKNAALEERMKERLDEQVQSVINTLGTAHEALETMAKETRACLSQSGVLFGRPRENTTSLISLDLNGGSGGETGDTTYVAPCGVQVECSDVSCGNSPSYSIGYLFSGTQTGSGRDYWLCRLGEEATLTFTFPVPLPIAMVRVHTISTHSRHGITGFTLVANYVDHDAASHTLASLSRGSWHAVPLAYGHVTSFTFHFFGNLDYIGANSIQVLLHPDVIPPLLRELGLFHGETVGVSTPCGSAGDADGGEGSSS